MEKKFRDMYDLIEHDSKAKAYFDKLPEYARDQMSTRANNVKKFSELKNYAENLTRGDG